MSDKKVNSKTAKYLLITAGTLSIILGFIGIFLPLLPTTPFMLLAAALFSKSSDRFYNWLINNRFFGSFIKNYREGKGISIQVKFISLTSLWLIIGSTIIYAVENIFIKIGLLIIAIGVTIHLLLIPTFSEKKRTKSELEKDINESVIR
ncbi:MAG: YbaN family protein [Bacteroidota bacterium]